MRVFFVNAYYNPNHHEGSRIHIDHVVKNLLEMGHEVWVQPYSPVRSALKLSWNRVERLLQIRKMDVFYMRIEGRPLGLPAYMREPWRRFGYAKRIVWEINAASDYAALSCGSDAESVRARLDVVFARQARQVDLAICNTEGLARFAKDLGIKNTRVIPLGTVPEMFGHEVSPAVNVSQRPDCLNVVWSGNPHAPWHDFETVREAAWLLRANANIRFYLIGELPRKVAFTDNVIPKGSVPYEDMPRYLKAMQVGLAIYKSDSWSRYGVFSSPLKLFDYFAASLVVVASPIEQVVECIEHTKNGFIVPYENPEALAERLCFLQAHKYELNDIGNRARDLAVGYYNWRRVTEETLDALQELF